MGTSFKPFVYKGKKAYNVKIQVIHNTKNTKVSTNITVSPDDVYRTSLKLKN